jgi:hypothetical protein
MHQLPIPEMAALSGPQQQVLRLLAQGESVTTAAAETNTSRKTIYRWLQYGTRFHFCLEAWRELLNQQWARQLLATTQNALQLLNEVITNPDAPVSARLRAATTVLNRDRKNGWPAAIHELALSARNVSPRLDFDDDDNDEGGETRHLPTENAVPSPPAPQNDTLSPVIPRNANCPCNSGKKFKRCCGKDAPPLLDAA